MNIIHPPWTEGEKIPDENIRDIFRRPPDVPLDYYRSTLVIGARGAGKTTLFRYLKAIHNGVAIHINLATEFGCITKQTGLGSLAFEISDDIESLVIGKATSLMALSISERLMKKEVNLPKELFLECIPSQLYTKTNFIDLDYILNVKRTIAIAPLSAFEGLSETQPLPNFVTAIAEFCHRSIGPLLLLFDRADMVISSTLIPVLQLLDQSSQYVALVAMRPSPVSENVANLSCVPGDHYSVVHLGTCPYSPDWLKFVEGAVEAQIGPKFSKVSIQKREEIISISRDSIKTSLELFSRYLSGSSKSTDDVLIEALKDLKENQLAACQRTLQRYHPDFRRMIREIRNYIIDQYERIPGPVVLSVERLPQTDLFDKSNKLDRFIEESLRCGAFCMPQDNRWVPGLRPSELEIPPILIWQKEDKFWTIDTASLVTIPKNEKELLSYSGGPKKFPTIFVAYRMRIKESKKFRTGLEHTLRSHPNLKHVKVTDGHVPAGVKWATKIHERIKKSKAVVADVTGMSPEVMFELGFAYGLKKAIIPVISKSSDIIKLPNWLVDTQLGNYQDTSGMRGICSSISAHISDPEYAKPPKPAQPIPALAVWLRELDWNKHVLNQFKVMTDRKGLTSNIYSDISPDESVIKRAASATLLVVNLDGTESDALMHFVCGAVSARPKAGTGGRMLSRIILIIEEPSKNQQSFVSESLRRCHETVRVINIDQVREETAKFGENYIRWASSMPKSRKK